MVTAGGRGWTAGGGVLIRAGTGAGSGAGSGSSPVGWFASGCGSSGSGGGACGSGRKAVAGRSQSSASQGSSAVVKVSDRSRAEKLPRSSAMASVAACRDARSGRRFGVARSARVRHRRHGRVRHLAVPVRRRWAFAVAGSSPSAGPASRAVAGTASGAVRGVRPLGWLVRHRCRGRIRRRLARVEVRRPRPGWRRRHRRPRPRGRRRVGRRRGGRRCRCWCRSSVFGVVAGVAAVADPPAEQVDQGVGAALLFGAFVSGFGDGGQRVEDLIDCDGVDRGQRGVQEADPVDVRADTDVAVVEGAAESFVGLVGFDLGDELVQPAAEDFRGFLDRDRHHQGVQQFLGSVVHQSA